LPGEEGAARRLPGEDPAPLAFGPVLTDLIPAAAGAWFDHHRFQRRLAEMMAGVPPADHVRRENTERALGRCLDADGLPNRCRRDLQFHSLVPVGPAALLAFCSSALPVDFRSVAFQRARPELVKPGADRTKAGRIDLIKAARALRPVGDQ